MSEDIKIKSIFMGNVYEKIFEFCDCRDDLYERIIIEANTIPTGNIKPYFREPYIHLSNKNILGQEKIYECKLNEKLFEEDKILLDDLNIEVKINKVIHTTNGTRIYYTDYTARSEETEYTKESKVKAEKQLKEEMIIYNKYSNIHTEKTKIKDNKKWWRFWK